MSIDPLAVWAMMKMTIWPERYWMLALGESDADVAAAAMLGCAGRYFSLIRDRGGLSVIVDEEGAADIDKNAGILGRFGPFKVVSTDGELPFNVVGFLRPLLEVLNSAGIKAGPICGTDHDHLFIFERDFRQAEVIIDEFIASSRREYSCLLSGSRIIE